MCVCGRTKAADFSSQPLCALLLLSLNLFRFSSTIIRRVAWTSEITRWWMRWNHTPLASSSLRAAWWSLKFENIFTNKKKKPQRTALKFCVLFLLLCDFSSFLFQGVLAKTKITALRVTRPPQRARLTLLTCWRFAFRRRVEIILVKPQLSHVNEQQQRKSFDIGKSFEEVKNIIWIYMSSRDTVVEWMNWLDGKSYTRKGEEKQ